MPVLLMDNGMMSSESQSPAVASIAERAGPVGVAIIEDHREFRDYLTALITGTEGFQCTGSFRSVEEALPRISAHVPDVILLDIGLPGMSGYEVARRLRDLPGFRDVFIVAVTGYGQDSDRRLSREAGFDHHLVKPVQPGILRDLIASAPLLQQG